MDYDSNAPDWYLQPYTWQCPTCFSTNAAMPVVKAGVECYRSLGVPPSKLVLAFPWYGYDYTCAARDQSPSSVCKVVKAAQLGTAEVTQKIPLAIPPGVRWQANSSTPFFHYWGVNSTLHRVDFDDSRSLRIKYRYAKEVGARGVGMWEASCVNYTSDQAAIF
eukprot:SAG11_NODE_13770_length_640_cov_1.249538_2_plen_162_part_01